MPDENFLMGSLQTRCWSLLGWISFPTNLKVGLTAQKPWNIQIFWLSYSQPLLFFPHLSILCSLLPISRLIHWPCSHAGTLVMIHTLIFSSQLFLLPRTYYASQVIVLLADVDYSPNAQEMLPKGLTAPNNITCFLLYPHKQALLYLFWTSNDFKKYYTDEIFSLDCLTWSYFFPQYCSK